MDKFAQIHDQIDATVEVMVQNLERVLQRGERIELLVQKTEELQTNASTFRKTSTDLKRHFWWRNMKIWIACGVALLVRSKLGGIRSLLTFPLLALSLNARPNIMNQFSSLYRHRSLFG